MVFLLHAHSYNVDWGLGRLSHIYHKVRHLLYHQVHHFAVAEEALAEIEHHVALHHVDEALREWVVVQAEANKDYVARLQQLLVSYDEDHNQEYPQLLLQTFELTETKATMISLTVDVQQGQLDL